MTTVLKNARIFSPSTATESGDGFASWMVIKNDQIVHIGSLDEIIPPEDATTIDLHNRIVIPGFIDAHVHILQYGLSLRKVDLIRCTSLEQIQQTIKTYAETHPSVPRILCRGWIQSTVDGTPLASMLDGIDTRPIYIEAADLHSTWCNLAALDEMEAHTTPDPPGGTIHRDENGRASGLLSEGAVMSFIWPFLDRVTSKEDKLDALRTAIKSYSAAGYTGVVDMAMSEDAWEILNLYRHDNKIPFHMAAHWLVPFSSNHDINFSHVDRAIELRRQFNEPDFCIAGIKLMCDGVVDGCTAALHQPYVGKKDPIDPIWPSEMMSQVIHRADAAGLQIAIHAIGDLAVHQSINLLSALNTQDQNQIQSSQPIRRHRIEHLELTSPDDAKRLGRLGITASVQPVHSDPAHFKVWPDLIGKARCKRAFAYKEFLDGGATVAFGTDAPTAAHFPFPNLYNATTRRSAVEPDSQVTLNPEFGLELVQAISAATEGAAYSRFAEDWTGALKKGLSADFVVVEMDWTPERLLEARVLQTWYRGKKVFDFVMDNEDGDGY
ncbi:amidohydrolase [Aspergillus lucknowensis]|uniref:Amidohydrolase 3 n=1 Tax=Aspergillus lucknowensis TaxID=176173 RepID=A0ABR4LS15_9EURO